jgi:hypothetical protein
MSSAIGFFTEKDMLGAAQLNDFMFKIVLIGDSAVGKS